MKALISTCSVFAVMLAIASSASAQSWSPKDGKIGKIDVEIQQTPQFPAGNVKDKRIPSPRNWVEIEVEFELSDRVIKGDFVDKVMLRYYIVVKGDNESRMMTGDVTHVYVPTGEDVYSIAYVPPAALNRVMGKRSNVTSSSILAVGVAIFINGVEIARGASGQPEGWWLNTQLQQESGVLAKSKTPFSIMWLDRHADEDTGN